jgi:hypothetical protein
MELLTNGDRFTLHDGLPGEYKQPPAGTGQQAAMLFSIHSQSDQP